MGQQDLVTRIYNELTEGQGRTKTAREREEVVVLSQRRGRSISSPEQATEQESQLCD